MNEKLNSYSNTSANGDSYKEEMSEKLKEYNRLRGEKALEEVTDKMLKWDLKDHGATSIESDKDYMKRMGETFGTTDLSFAEVGQVLGRAPRNSKENICACLNTIRNYGPVVNKAIETRLKTLSEKIDKDMIIEPELVFATLVLLDESANRNIITGDTTVNTAYLVGDNGKEEVICSVLERMKDGIRNSAGRTINDPSTEKKDTFTESYQNRYTYSGKIDSAQYIDEIIKKLSKQE